MIARPAQSGFSLVELSIVLVILGLLTGGILGGQALIRAAELRSVTTEYQRYATAIQTFRDKYMAVPGDMANATAFWGSAGGTGSDDACYSAVSTTTTCNGNGNGQIWINGATTRPEFFRAWQQLAAAGLIEGTYSGVAGAGGWEHAVRSTNVPAAKLSNGMWQINWFSAMSGSPTYFDGPYGEHIFILGRSTSGGAPMSPILRPEEAWNIDTKMDDGNPALGQVLVLRSQSPNCPTTNVVSTAQYALTNTGINCTMLLGLGS